MDNTEPDQSTSSEQAGKAGLVDETSENDSIKCSATDELEPSNESRKNEPISTTEFSASIISSSENVNNENREKEMQRLCPSSTSLKDEDDTSSTNSKYDKYAKHTTYNEDGIAIYTDPETNYQYKWCTEKNEWIPADINENEHYRWCSETNQWIPKEKDKTVTENEFYKWDETIKEWIPKVGATDTYSYENGVHTYKDKDGAEFFWDTSKNAWFPKIDDEFLARYQMNYGFIDNTTPQSDDNLPSKPENVVDQQNQLKRKGAPEPPKWFDLPPEHNTKVYVSNLPLDITEEEFVSVMSKCGMIMRDPKTEKYKVKLYAEPDGQLKGDGLCDYIKVESVDLALNLLDGYDVRGQKIKVQRAKFQMRGEYNPALKPKKKKKDKEKLQKMKEKLFDWRPEKMRGERSKHERVVVLKNLFEPELFDKEVHLIIDYQNDLREECGKCGTVRKVVLYDRHPEGIAQITMADPDEADLVIQMMNGRFFGKRKLTAETWDGKTKFKIGETDAEFEKRLSNWDKFLETDDKKPADEIVKEPAAETKEE